ncbi:MAG: O-succinylbenzoic acid--CoA ligase [Candidatus Marinamargulisbacteria bacterium]|jgi:O-succinylbenzoic acid--CoA ligase
MMPMTPCPVSLAALHSPKKDAIIDLQTIYSYERLDAMISAAMTDYEEQGIKKGDPIVLEPRSTISEIVSFFAILRLGAIVCPINPKFPASLKIEIAKKLNLKNSTQKQSDSLDPKPTTKGSLPAIIVQTSGSSGFPKSAVSSVNQHLISAEVTTQYLDFDTNCSWLLSLPLYHISGISILFRAFFQRGTIIIPAKKTPIGELVSKLKPSHISVVPTQLMALTENPAKDTRFLKCVLVGGAACPPDILQKALLLNLPVFTTYGLTEFASQVSTGKQTTQSEAKMPSSGRPLDHAKIKISEDGEILIKGKSLFSGYWKKGEIVSPSLVDGWFQTKDTGLWAANNELVVTGRIDNRFISGGENICPEEIECHLTEHPNVEQAKVVPVQDSKFGHRPVAFIKGAANLFECPRDLRLHLSKKLPSFMIPDIIFEWPKDEVFNGPKTAHHEWESQTRLRMAEISNLKQPTQHHTCK